jgi:hypothetical protein
VRTRNQSRIRGRRRIVHQLVHRTAHREVIIHRTPAARRADPNTKRQPRNAVAFFVVFPKRRNNVLPGVSTCTLLSYRHYNRLGVDSELNQSGTANIMISFLFVYSFT